MTRVKKTAFVLTSCFAALWVAFLQASESSPTRGGFLDAFEDGDYRIGDYSHGEVFDWLNSPARFLELNPRSKAPIPEPPFELIEPAVVVSLAGLTCRLYDKRSELEIVYPVGVGVRAAQSGLSITPVGGFSTHSQRGEPWFYIWERRVPSYFDGLPFLRITALNDKGQPTYGFHGPITETLKRGYVSHGCIRMRPDDIKDLFAVAFAHPGMDVEIQQAIDIGKSGAAVDVDYPRFGSRG